MRLARPLIISLCAAMLATGCTDDTPAKPKPSPTPAAQPTCESNGDLVTVTDNQLRQVDHGSSDGHYTINQTAILELAQDVTVVSLDVGTRWVDENGEVIPMPEFEPEDDTYHYTLISGVLLTDRTAVLTDSLISFEPVKSVEYTFREVCWVPNDVGTNINPRQPKDFTVTVDEEADSDEDTVAVTATTRGQAADLDGMDFVLVYRDSKGNIIGSGTLMLKITDLSSSDGATSTFVHQFPADEIPEGVASVDTYPILSSTEWFSDCCK